jgi:hypothetical protein
MNDDSDLIRLFDEAQQPLPADAFVATILENIRQSRRQRLLRQVGMTAVVLIAGAWAAPYAAEQTLRTAGWLAEGWTGQASELALASPLGWLCGALIIWRIVRQRLQ